MVEVGTLDFPCFQGRAVSGGFIYRHATTNLVAPDLAVGPTPPTTLPYLIRQPHHFLDL